MVKTECVSTSKTMESEKGKLIMLVNDFYYGKDEGDLQQVQQEQKTHTTFKCVSCLKVLKNNIRYLNSFPYLFVNHLQSIVVSCIKILCFWSRVPFILKTDKIG